VTAELLVYFVSGVVLLIVGAELLVRGASRMARAVGISPLVVGLTVVAFGTSSPEMAVSVGAALHGNTDVCLGNVVGSNTFNVLVILGLSASVVPLAVARLLLLRDVPVMIAVSLIVPLLAFSGNIGRVEGFGLLGGLMLYVAFTVVQSLRECRELPVEPHAVRLSGGAITFQVMFVVGGLGLLVLGAEWLVVSSTQFARLWGVSELVIGLTVVAAGTSLPEVAASLVAALRGERDIAVGNVVGSNIFNILGVLGMSAVISPNGVPVPASAMTLDIPVMAAAAVLCLPVFVSGRTVERWEGAIFLACYAAYTVLLILQASNHEALPTYTGVLKFVALPIVISTVLVSLVWARRARGAASAASPSPSSPPDAAA